MTQDVPALPEVPDGRRYRAWDGSVWSDRDSRDVHNHTHPAGGVPGFAPVSWNDDELWGSIDARRWPGTGVAWRRPPPRWGPLQANTATAIVTTPDQPWGH